MCIKKKLTIGFCVYVTALLCGCAVVAEKTNFLSDNDIKSKVAGTLGYSPNDITLTSRRTEGTDTYAVVSTKNNKQFACTLNGGNLLTAGIVNPPNCVAKN
jgi:hypothetical protein